MGLNNQVKNNETDLQFELEEGNKIATLVYRFYKKDIAFMHTFVPDSMKGKGVASALAEVAFRFAMEKNKLVIPSSQDCPYVAKYVKSYPEMKEQLDKEFHH